MISLTFVYIHETVSTSEGTCLSLPVPACLQFSPNTHTCPSASVTVG